jgi:hypothetical protein
MLVRLDATSRQATVRILRTQGFAAFSLMRIHQLSASDALASLQSSPLGLSSLQAKQRLREHGLNVVPEYARESPWFRLLREFFQFFSLILWAAAGLAFVSEWSDPRQGMAKIGYAIVIVILVSGAFSFWQEYRVERTLAALRQLLPQTAKLLRDGTVILASAAHVVPGDIVVLEPGDHVPADCRLVEAFDVRVDNAAPWRAADSSEPQDEEAGSRCSSAAGPAPSGREYHTRARLPGEGRGIAPAFRDRDRAPRDDDPDRAARFRRAEDDARPRGRIGRHPRGGGDEASPSSASPTTARQSRCPRRS